MRDFTADAKDSISKANYEQAVESMEAAGELRGPVLGADGQPVQMAWTFQCSVSVNINWGPVNFNYTVGLAGDSNGGLAVTRTRYRGARGL